MLNAKNLLESLSNTENEEDFKYENDDYDFVEVMKFCEETHMTKNEVMSVKRHGSLVFEMYELKKYASM